MVLCVVACFQKEIHFLNEYEIVVYREIPLALVQRGKAFDETERLLII